MYPAYNCTDSYPHHTKQMIPSHMKMDLNSPKPTYQPWYYNGNYPYPVPHQYHGCCNHNCYGGGPYGFWPPYTHYPPPPPPPAFHPHGLYSPYPGAFPAYYVPPQHYSVEQPRYEYDKTDHAPHHCCGCHHREDEKRPKIKEESHVGKDPIMWVPRDYMSNDESKAKEKEKYAHDLEPSKRGGNAEIAQDERGGTGGNQFPFKIFWLPSKNDEVGKDTNESNLDQVTNKGLSNEKKTKKNEGFGSEGERETTSKHGMVAPEKQASANKDDTNGKHAVRKVIPVKQASADEETGSKHAVQKVIPVKHVSADEEEENLKSAETIVNSDHVEKTDNGSKASPRTPKLPPVCLRVDPLPRKKKSSRSPSPGEKGRSNDSPVNSPKSSQQQAQVLKKNEERDGGHIKNVEHANKVERDNLVDHDDVQSAKGDESEKRKVEEKKNLIKAEHDEGRVKTVEHADKVEVDNVFDHGDVPRGKEDQSEKRKVEEKKKLSEDEAALIIQSVYHGFEVRKSKPLKKLKQIYEVKKQVLELRNHIQDLEASSTIMNIDGKKKLIVGETIMSLLLKLDTIQGLHPFVREVRKSVAKELVGLQEKLDSLSSATSETPSEGTMCRPQQVMHPEDDAIQVKSDQAQAQTGLCENHEQQLENRTEDEAVADKFHQTPTESDTVVCEKQVGEALDPQEGVNTIGDQVPTEHDEALGLSDNQEVEATESQEGCNTIGELQQGLHKETLDQAQTVRDQALGLCENHEVECTESQEGCNTIGEPQLESEKYNLDQAPSESNEALQVCENHEVTTTESQEGCNVNEEPHIESHNDKLDTESDEALRLCEKHDVESTEGFNTIGIGELQKESNKEKMDQAPTKCDNTGEALGLCDNHEVKPIDNADVEAHDNMKLEHNSQMPVETDVHVDNLVQGTSVETMVNDSNACQQLHEVEAAEAHNDNGTDTDAINPEPKVVSCESENVQMDDGSMMEMKLEEGAAKEIQDSKVNDVKRSSGGLADENEKLRMAVEELMKAGNDQLGVIRELTGRVKDLEKKLSKNKKLRVKNKGRRSRGCVVQKD